MQIMQIMTISGKTFEADWADDTTDRHGAQQLTIHFPGTTDLVEILHELIGAEQISGIKKNGVRVVYEGYKHLYSAIYNHDRSAVRVTLVKGDAA